MANAGLLPRMAGNFLFVRAGPDGPVIVGSGSSGDLSLARHLGPAAAADHFAEAVYIHLNVSRSERSKVQADIAQRHAPSMIAADFDLSGEVIVANEAPQEHPALG